MATTQKAKADLLKNVPLFEGLSKAQLRTVASQLTERLYAPGEQIVREGASGGGFFLVVEGRARVTVGARKVRSAGPGDFFGEMSLLDGEPRAGSVSAETRVVVLAMTSWNFLATLEENWAITKKVLADLSRRVRAADKAATA